MANLRRWVRVLHRDVGYFLAGLVVVFAISGVAVNHVDAWNPSYERTTTPIAIGPLSAPDLDGMEREVVARVPLAASDVRGRRRASPNEFHVFLDEGGEATVDPATGKGTLLVVRRRTLLFETNVLHLNHLKGAWTIVSDAFAVLLAGLAISGLFMLKGSTGLAGRGKWFVAGGLVVPVAFVIHYYATR